MLTHRPAAERGRTRLAWLDSRHSFSFDQYYDPRHMGFRSLRVINDDLVAPGAGFPAHPHRDMEILTWVIEGAVDHADSMGTGSTVRAGEMQRMSAGSGITHSEFNHSPTEPLRLLQIWIRPERKGIPPGYEQKAFSLEQRRNRLLLAASRDGRNGSLTLCQDAEVYIANPDAGAVLSHRFAQGRHGWIQVARGSLSVNGVELQEGDGLAVTGEESLEIRSSQGAEFLLFDLA
jgi:redox-sensitive bicupin YhaK (pirin superfamily)